MEIWKDVLDYEGYYQVSNKGKVKSLERTVESVSHGKPCLRHIKGFMIRLQSNCRHGYIQVGLKKEGKRKVFYVYRLVWEAFNGRVPEGMEIDHIIPILNGGTDELSNLRCVTHKANCNNPLSIENKIKSLTGKFKGELNPNYGKHRLHTEETKRKISEASKAFWRRKHRINITTPSGSTAL